MFAQNGLFQEVGARLSVTFGIRELIVVPLGYGQPECFNSETCLFTSAYGYFYEGCGQTSIAYNWITGIRHEELSGYRY